MHSATHQAHHITCTTCPNCADYQQQIRKLELERDLALLTIRQLLTDRDVYHAHQRLEAMGVTRVLS